MNKVAIMAVASILISGMATVSTVHSQSDAPTCPSGIGRYQIALTTGSLAGGTTHRIYETKLDTCTGEVVHRHVLATSQFGSMN